MTTAVAWMAPVCALIGVCMAGYLGSWVLRQDPGPDKMNSISIKIQQGAKAFLMSEYKLLVIFMIIVAVVMAIFLSPITAARAPRLTRPPSWATPWAIRSRTRPVRP